MSPHRIDLFLEAKRTGSVAIDHEATMSPLPPQRVLGMPPRLLGAPSCRCSTLMGRRAIIITVLWRFRIVAAELPSADGRACHGGQEDGAEDRRGTARLTLLGGVGHGRLDGRPIPRSMGSRAIKSADAPLWL